jgi:hypothetical protein
VYCNENSPVPICCQHLKSSPDKSVDEQKQQELQAAEAFFNEDVEKEEEVDCPNNSLMILTDEGQPASCTNDGECPQVSSIRGMINRIFFRVGCFATHKRFVVNPWKWLEVKQLSFK